MEYLVASSTHQYGDSVLVGRHLRLEIKLSWDRKSSSGQIKGFETVQMRRKKRGEKFREMYTVYRRGDTDALLAGYKYCLYEESRAVSRLARLPFLRSSSTDTS